MVDGMTSQNKMIRFVRRKNGWMAIPEDMSDWLQVCYQIAKGCKMGVTTFEDDCMQIVSENVTCTVEFNLDNTMKSKMLLFESGEKGEVFMSENERKAL
jgi:hypothetical protein